MGRKHLVPYALYRAHGFVSPQLAKQTGFSEDDLAKLWTALENMFELDRSAARGTMSSRLLCIFRHESPYGDAPAHRLFDAISVRRRPNGGTGPARSFGDYEIQIDRSKIPDQVNLETRPELAGVS
jgi:CRISPR-associated protein Csd2